MANKKNNNPINNGKEYEGKNKLSKSSIVIILVIILIILFLIMYNLFYDYKDVNNNSNQSNEFLSNEKGNIQISEENIETKKYTLEEFDSLEEFNTEDIVVHNGIEYNALELSSIIVQRNTYFSFCENYNDNLNEIFEKYCSDYSGLGDEAGLVAIDSNYKQYNSLLYKPNIYEYKEPIVIKMGYLHENTMNLDEVINSKIEYTIENLLKLQYDKSTDSFGNEFKKEDGFFEIKGISIMNGNNSTDDNWKTFARAKKIKITINEEEKIVDLEDKKEVQLIDFEYKQNTIKKPIEIKIEVLESYPGILSNDVYISDIRCGFGKSISSGR